MTLTYIHPRSGLLVRVTSAALADLCGAANRYRYDDTPLQWAACFVILAMEANPDD